MADPSGLESVVEIKDECRGTNLRRNLSNSALQDMADHEPMSPQDPKILLSDEDVDLDVIVCTTEEFNSDIEDESAQKGRGSAGDTGAKKAVYIVPDVVTPEEGNTCDGDTPEVDAADPAAAGEDVDDDENIEMMLENSSPTRDDTQPVQPLILSGKNAGVLNTPLRKEIIPQIAISDDEDDVKIGTVSQESLSLQIDSCVTAASEALGKSKSPCLPFKDENDSKGHRNDDSEILKLNWDQNIGDLDYELDDEEHRTGLHVKQEPGTVKERMQQLNFCPDDMPTIDITMSSDDGEPACRIVHEDTPKSRKKRSRKKKNVCSDDCVSLKPHSSEESVSKSVSSDRSLISIHSMGCLEEACYGDRRMALRKRTITILPGAVLSTSTKKVRPRKLSMDMEPVREILKKVKRVSFIGSDAGDGKKADKSGDNRADEEQMEKKKVKKLKRKKSVGPFDVREAIERDLAKELAETEDNSKTDDESNTLEPPTTDIALEDMLDLYEDKPEEDKPFHSISSEEKLLMDSLFPECPNQSLSRSVESTAEPIETMLDDGKPLLEEKSDTEEALPIVASYTVYNPNPENPADVCIGENPVDQSNGDQDEANQKKLPRFKIVQNYHKYPPPQKAPKAPPKKTKLITALPRRGRKRRNSNDSEYLPSYARTRRISIRPRKPPTSRKRETFVPTGEFIPEDSELLQQQQPAAEDGTVISMPSLEEDLALSCSESSISELAVPKSASVASASTGLSTCSLQQDKTDGEDGGSKKKEPPETEACVRKRGRPRRNTGC